VHVVAINIAPGARLPMRPTDEVVVEQGKGIVGDRYHGSRHRQVTVQSREALDRAAAKLGHPFDSAATRRNITVDAGEIPTRPGTLIRIGGVTLEVVRVAAPCRLMDDSVGPGATAALRGCAGSACRVLQSGTIRIGDPVEIADP